jgi:hypothetical protein
MFGRKVVEGEQGYAVLGQAAHGPVVLRPVLAGELIEGGLGVDAVFRLVDRMQVLLGLTMHRFRQIVEHVGGLLNP